MNLESKLYKTCEKYPKNANNIHTYHDAASGGSITYKTAREANQLFEEFVKTITKLLWKEMVERNKVCLKWIKYLLRRQNSML